MKLLNLTQHIVNSKTSQRRSLHTILCKIWNTVKLTFPTSTSNSQSKFVLTDQYGRIFYKISHCTVIRIVCNLCKQLNLCSVQIRLFEIINWLINKIVQIIISTMIKDYSNHSNRSIRQKRVCRFHGLNNRDSNERVTKQSE